MAKKQKTANTSGGDRSVARNRQAFFNYEILDRYQAGLVLTGTEIKSIRAGKVDLRDGYARAQKGEMWLVNTYIAPYDPASVYNHDPRRTSTTRWTHPSWPITATCPLVMR